MSSRSLAVAAALLPVLSVGPARAADEADTGTRVRVVKKGGGGSIVGRLVARAPERLTIETEPGRSPVQVPFAQVQRLQVSEGRNRGKGLAIGALVGLVLGGAVYVASTSDCSEIDCGKRFALIAGPSVAVGALAGVGFAPERWRTVDRVPEVTSIDRSRRFGFAVRPARGGVTAAAAVAF